MTQDFRYLLLPSFNSQSFNLMKVNSVAYHGQRSRSILPGVMVEDAEGSAESVVLDYSLV